MDEKIRELAKAHAGITPEVTDIESLQFSAMIERVIAYEKYHSYLAGISEAFRWRDVNDRSEPMPKGDCLIKTETGKIFRYYEDWEDERELVTHWRPLNIEGL